MKMWRVARLLTPCVAATLITTGCGSLSSGGGGSSTNGSSKGGVVNIGFTATLTGADAQYGVAMEQGVQLAVQQINAAGGIAGKHVKVVVRDDQGEPSNAATIAQNFCDDSNMAMVFGYSFSSTALSAIPVFKQCSLPVVMSSPTSVQLTGSYPGFFRNVVTDNVQGQVMADYAAAKGYKRVAILNLQTAYGIGLADRFGQVAKQKGITVTSRQGFQSGVTDFSTQLAKLKGQNVQAIFVGAYYDAVANVAKQAKQAGLTVPVMCTDGCDGPDLLHLGGQAVEGTAFTAMYTPENPTSEAKQFTTAFKKKYGQAPQTEWTALAYDAVDAFKAAAEKAGGTSRADVTKGMHEIKAVAGATGPTTFGTDGERADPKDLVVVIKGNESVVSKG